MRLFSSFCAYVGEQNSASIAINEKIFFISLRLSKPSVYRLATVTFLAHREGALP
jgi:hypothetical protein